VDEQAGTQELETVRDSIEGLNEKPEASKASEDALLLQSCKDTQHGETMGAGANHQGSLLPLWGEQVTPFLQLTIESSRRIWQRNKKIADPRFVWTDHGLAGRWTFETEPITPPAPGGIKQYHGPSKT
jgi:hypothetical protein